MQRSKKGETRENGSASRLVLLVSPQSEVRGRAAGMLAVGRR